MIIWLASYPRSGNTMLRNMMRQVFGMGSYSEHGDSNDVGSIAEVREQSGHQEFTGPFEAFYRQTLTTPDATLVKTHRPPIDSERAIYVVRDGRSAIVSWFNMLTNLRKRTDVTITDIILGRKVPWVDWSTHISNWNPEKRPRTLLLKYQELVKQPDEAMQRVAAFIERKPIAQWQDNFATLHELFPDFFHSGSDEKNLAQMSAADEKLFWVMHGEYMKRFDLGSPRT